MLLYIEDNVAIAENVKAYLEAEGFVVDRVADGKEWLDKALSNYYELIILDIMLPSMDGFAICRELRKYKQLPIIMTTAKGELDDKSEGFDGGADDYLVKPFELQELVMRIHALLKRSQVSDSVSYGEIELLLDENRCYKSGQEVKLTLKEWQILMELVDANGVVFSRADIIESVWWGESLYENDNKLDVYIANLRKKLDKSLIETVKGFWYRLKK